MIMQGLFKLSDGRQRSRHNASLERATTQPLPPVQEGQEGFGRSTLPSDDSPAQRVASEVRLQREQNPSQRPLGRKAAGALDAYARREAAAKRAVYAQEGDDMEPSSFKATVAELLQEEEYGIFRLVAPTVNVPRDAFNAYVEWLDSERQVPGRRVSTDKATQRYRSVFGLPVLPPYSRLSFGWMGLMMAVDLVWTAFGVPINVAFCSVDYGRRGSTCTSTDLAFGVVYLANLLMSFQLGVLIVNGHRKKAVMHGARLAWYYMRYGRFALDVAAIVPFFYLLVVLGVSDGRGYRSKWVNAVSLIRLLRLLRLVSVSKVIYIDSALGRDGWLARYLNVANLYALMVGYQTAVIVNLLACLLLLLAFLHGPENSWMATRFDLVEASRAYQWYSAVYWVLTTATTTGYGDFSPTWWGEQVVTNVCMVIGMLSFGILVATITNALARANTASSRLQVHVKKISQVNDWLRHCSLRPPSKLAVQEYFAQLFVSKQDTSYGEAELFCDLPPYLRFEVASELALPLIQKVHALRELNLDAQQFVASHFRPVRMIVGQELCRQGDEADRLWLLASGRLVALRHKERPQQVAAPALAGESLILAMDMPECRHRPWSLRAATPCQLWELHLTDLSRVMQIYPATRLTLMEHLRSGLVRHIFLLTVRHPSAEATEAEQAHPQKDWCELLTLLRSSLERMQAEVPASLDNLSVELERAHIEDGSLQRLLSELIEGSLVRDGLAPEAVLGLPLLVQQHAHALQQQQQHQQQHPHPYPHTLRTISMSRGGLQSPFVSRNPTPTRDPTRAHGPPPGWPAAPSPSPGSRMMGNGNGDASGGGSGGGGGGGGITGPLGAVMRRIASQHRYLPGGGGSEGSSGRSTASAPVQPPPGGGWAPRAASLELGRSRADSGAVTLVVQGEPAEGVAQGEPAAGGVLAAAGGMGAGGADAGAGAEGEEEEDPIAAETGVPSPRPTPRPPHAAGPAVAAASIASLRSDGGGADGAASPTPQDADAGDAGPSLPPPPVRTTAPATRAASVPAPSSFPPQPTPGGGALPSYPAGAAAAVALLAAPAARRSTLSRPASPFASGSPFAVAPHHAALAAPSPPQPPPPPAGAGPGPDPRVHPYPHPHPLAGQQSQQQQQPEPPRPACAHCGAAACPACGLWMAGNPDHPALTALAASLAASAAAPQPPPAALSLADAIRGGRPRYPATGGGGGAAQPPPPLLLPTTSFSPAYGYGGAGAGGAGGGGPPPVAASPARALGRRSQMFGRSMAAAARMDTLVRDTLWAAYSEQPEGGGLAEQADLAGEQAALQHHVSS